MGCSEDGSKRSSNHFNINQAKINFFQNTNMTNTNYINRNFNNNFRSCSCPACGEPAGKNFKGINSRCFKCFKCSSLLIKMGFKCNNCEGIFCYNCSYTN